MKDREGLGSSLPPVELAMRDSTLFEKMKCIFSIAPLENLEKSQETRRWPGGTGRSACTSGVLSASSGVRVKHQTLCTGRGLDPVCASGVA